jgi:ABC-type antimicrobial peptide transport system permease subunit
MNSREYILAAIESLRQHRMRALLTMLGIIVGVFTVMLTLSIGAGARLAIEAQINSLGSNLVVLNSGPPPSQGHQAIYLYPADAHAILETISNISAVAPQQETRLSVQFGSVQLSSNFVMGVTGSYADVRGADLATGRFIQLKDDDQIAKVAVLGSTVAQYLFGSEDALGRRILINNVDFEVIGVLKTKGDSPGLGPGMSTDDRIFIPLSALQKRLLGTADLRLIAIAARSQADIPAVAESVKRLMDKRHPGNPFELKSQTELLETSNSVSGIVNLLLISLAGVSLIVGGIGIANIMLVSVTERTREIGIRRALGATRKNVQRQFLIESIVLSGLGGGTGVLLGTAVPLAIGFALHWRVPILPQGIMLAFSAATLVGIISGLYPARRASKLDVVEALRFE